MAGRDNVLFGAAIGSATAAGTVVPLSLMYGIENVRQGYGQPVLKNIRSYFYGCYTTANASNIGIPIKVKNSNWIDEAGLVSQKFSLDTAINRDSYAFMRGRDKPLAPNTAWTINAEIAANTTAAGYVYVLLEIEYPDVQGFDAEDLKGSPSSSSARTHPLPELPTPSFPSERSTISSRELSTYSPRSPRLRDSRVMRRS